jgi:hypothetical protein
MQVEFKVPRGSKTYTVGDVFINDKDSGALVLDVSNDL